MSPPFARFLLLASIPTAAGALAAWRLNVPVWAGALAGLNLALLLLYGYDKAVAGGARTRVPERLLHLLALAGGSPAALLGQSLFRHKTAKAPFRSMTLFIVVLQATAVAAVLYWTRRP